MYICATTIILLEPFGLEIDFVLMEYKSKMAEVRMTESRTLHVVSISPRARFVLMMCSLSTRAECKDTADQSAPCPQAEPKTPLDSLLTYLTHSLCLPPSHSSYLEALNGGAFAFHCRFH